MQDLSHRIANGLQAAEGGERGEQKVIARRSHVVLRRSRTSLGIVKLQRQHHWHRPVECAQCARRTDNILDCVVAIPVRAQPVRGAAATFAVRSAQRRIVHRLPNCPGVPGLQSLGREQPTQPSRRPDRRRRRDPRHRRHDGGCPRGVLISHTRNYLAMYANWYAAMPVRERPMRNWWRR